MAELLRVERLASAYGRSQALFSVAAGEVVALLCRNSVGKTTAVMSIMGLQPVQVPD